MFTVAKKPWWKKPKYSVPLAGTGLVALATICGAFIVAPGSTPPPPPRHVVNRPVLPTPTVKISEIEEVCGRRPGDHTTFHVTVENAGEKIISVMAGKLNIGRIGYRSRPYPASNLHWHGCGDFRFNQVFVTISADAIEGQSIPFAVNLELPPMSTRDFYLTVFREHPQDKRDECFLAHGAITFFATNGIEFSTGGLYFAGE